MEKNKLIGVMIDDLGVSQLNFYLINHINILLNNHADKDMVVFIKNLVPPSMRPECAVIHSNEIWSFNGTLISTTLDSALSSLKAVSTARRILYMWDLEWLRPNKNNYIQNLSILRNPKLEVVTRCQDYAHAISNYANLNNIKVVPDFNLQDIIS